MQRLSKAQAQKTIKHLGQKGNVILSRHAKDRMAEKGITIYDVHNVLQHGSVLSEPEPHIKTGNLIYNVVGKDIEGAKLRVSVEILDSNGLIVVTVIN